MSPIAITAAQRDALYEQILIGLSGIGDVWLAIEAEDYQGAERLGRVYSDDLRLVLDDLGWAEGSGETIELSTPPDVLLRVLPRLRKIAASQSETDERERAEAQLSAERNLLVIETCEALLAGLGEVVQL